MSVILPSCQRINHQPEMILGLNGTELLAVLFLSLLSGMGASALITIPLGLTSFFMLIGFSLSVLLGAISSKLLKAIKRQRPEGYYQQWVMVNVGKFAGRQYNVLQGGVYDYRRHDG